MPETTAAPLRQVTLLLVRHGETVYNAEKRFQGSRDISLSETGRTQTRALADRLKVGWERGGEKPLIPGPPAAVFASDLSRAFETATLLAASILDTPAVQPLPLLRERGFGAWEGLTQDEIAVRFPGQTEPDGAEPWASVWERMRAALGQIWDRCPTSGDAGTAPPVALVVGHGGSLRALLALTLGGDMHTMRRFHLDNTGLSLIGFRGTSPDDLAGRVYLVNDTSHLHNLT